MPIDDLRARVDALMPEVKSDLAALSAIPPVAFPGFPPRAGDGRERDRSNSCAGMAWTMSGSWTFPRISLGVWGDSRTSRIADGSAVWS